MLRYRERIEHVRLAKCVRRQPDGRHTVFSYFHCVLGRESWTQYSSDIQSRKHNVETTVLGAKYELARMKTAESTESSLSQAATGPGH